MTSAWATFGKKQVEVQKAYECSFILHGESIPGKYFYLSKPRLLARWKFSKKVKNFKKTRGYPTFYVIKWKWQKPIQQVTSYSLWWLAKGI